MNPPKIEIKDAKRLGITEVYLAKINAGGRTPSLKLACELARYARDIGHDGVTIADWLPNLLKNPIWPELTRLCQKKKIKASSPPK